MTALVRYEQARYALAEAHRVDEVKDIRDKAEAMAAAEWVAHARKLFAPSERSPCAVCGRFKSLSHAHHIVPLAMQAQGDRMSVNNDHVWLCPTHHAAVHIYIGAGSSVRGRASTSVIEIAAELEIDELRQVMNLAGKAWV